MNIVNVKRGAKGAHNPLLTAAGLAMALTLSLLLPACGGGGGGSSSSSSSSSTSSGGGASTTVAVSGTVADTVSGKPNMEHGGVLRGPVNNATVRAIDATGAVAASTTTNTGGQYTLALAPNTKYVIRVSYGNVVMKAVTSVANAAVTADVTPRTTAHVMVLAQSLGVSNMGESGTSFSAAISAVDITTAIAAIDSAGITPLVTAVQTAITGGVDPFSASTVTSEAQTLSATVSLASAGVPSPSAPTGVSAIAGAGQVTVSWSAVTGATSYNVYRGTSAGVTTAGAKTTGATSGGAITGLTNGTAYYFVVTAVNAGGESAVSGEAAATPQVPAPGQPSGLNAAAGNGQVSLSWTAVDSIPNATITYSVYRSTASGTQGGAIATGVSGVAYADTTAANGTTYYYGVSAVDAGGESVTSTQASASPKLAAPGNVSVTAGNARVTLTWTAVANAASYNVYYGTTNGISSTVYTLGTTKVTGATSGLAIVDLPNGTTHYFVVTAVDAGGETAATVVSATPQLPVPPAPGGVSATAGDTNALISWTAPLGAVTSYTVYYGTSSGVTTASTTKSAGITGTSTNITGLANGTACYFIVTAVNSSGEGTPSSQVSATPTLTVPAAPASPSVTAGDAGATVSWTAPAGAVTSYNVYYGTTSGVTVATGTKVAGQTSGGTITGLTNGTTYYFIVTAVNAAGEGAASSAVSAMPQVALPDAPTGVGATMGITDATLTWTAASGATSYSIYYRTANNSTQTRVQNATSGQTISGLSSGTSYIFTVKAENVRGETASADYTASTLALPAPASAPGNVIVQAGDAQVTVSWNAVSGATNYSIGYSQTSGQAANFNPAVTGLSGTSHTITSLSNSSTYYFSVRAVNSAGNGPASTEVSATPLIAVPTAPANVSASAGNTQVTVSWTASASATSYNVYYGTSSGVTTASTTKSTGITGTSTAITGLTNSTTYYFIVTGVNSSGEGLAGSQASAMPREFMVSAIAVGGSFGVALKGDGSLLAWGNNGTGALGDGTTTSRASAVQVSGLTGVASIAGGNAHTVALKSDGTVWAWGWNSYGQLGDGTATQRQTPVQVSGLASVAAVADGDYHSIALKGDGTVWAWGRNWAGNLGDGTTTNRNTPVQVSGLTNIVAVAGGAFHTLALKGDGTVWAWGYNSTGQLGDGTTTNRYTPVQVSGLTGVTAIAAGSYHSVAQKSDGTVWACGENAYGQLGDVSQTNRLTPVQANGLTGATAVAGGLRHTLALKSDGTVWAWGESTFGQVGDGTNLLRTAPVQVSGLTGATAIEAGDYHSVALKGDSSVWAWGRNDYLALGASPAELCNSFSCSSSPVQTGGFTALGILAPTGVSATAGAAQATISWNAVTGATSYNIYWSTSPDVNPMHGTKITAAASGYVHTGRTAGVRYYYVVTAVNATGESAASMAATAVAQ